MADISSKPFVQYHTALLIACKQEPNTITVLACTNSWESVRITRVLLHRRTIHQRRTHQPWQLITSTMKRNSNWINWWYKIVLKSIPTLTSKNCFWPFPFEFYDLVSHIEFGNSTLFIILVLRLYYPTKMGIGNFHPFFAQKTSRPARTPFLM